MKRAKQRRIKPRNPVVIAASTKKSGAHRRRDKRAARALQKARLRREMSEV